jgi:P pilus assembly chaperone PapD
MLKSLNDFQHHTTKLFFTGVFLFLSMTSFSNAMAQGNLLINPKRVVFDDRKHFQEINLANTGNDTARYLISFIQIRMNEDGRFEEINEPDSGQMFAHKYLRIFPRSVTLAPTEAQVVKIQVSQSSKMLPGEYRSHLYFRAVPKENPLGGKSVKADTTNVSVRLTPVFGISIPVIIRTGESTAKVNLSNLHVEALPDSLFILQLKLNRTGNMSVYGNLIIEHISTDGKITRAALVKGVSVYTPNASRVVRIKLDQEAAIDYRSGKLNVFYSRPAEEKSEKLASAELALN